MDYTEKRLKLDGADALLLFGYNDSNLHLIENRYDATVTVRGDAILIRGESDEVKQIEKILLELQYIIHHSGKLEVKDVTTVIDLIAADREASRRKPSNTGSSGTLVYQGHKDEVRARTATQKSYVEKVRSNDVVFAIGPAGTGKTYLAVALALSSLKNGEIGRIVISRPAVEAGESLGFLPGDFQEKVDPYLRPIFDALSEMLGGEKLKSLMEKRIVEVIPLAYMRGRTFNNSFIILDEAQNSTVTQMKMFLTRLGRNSKAVITGDITQIDLDGKSDSGLVDVQFVLSEVRGISFIYFDRNDVVRHRLVADIIDAYEQSQDKSESSAPQRKSKGRQGPTAPKDNGRDEG